MNHEPQPASDLPPLPQTPPGRYRHYKGGEYEVIGVARHSESLDPLVVYRPLYNASGLWVRPHAMFFGNVSLAGESRPRFAPLDGQGHDTRTTTPSPIAVVQAQLDAYNAKDIEALLQTYAPDAEQFTLHGELLARGRDQLRARYLARFTEPDLHASLVSRTIVGNVVTDTELITRNFPEGLGTLEMLCIYEIIDGRIRRASFASGQKTLSPIPPARSTSA